MSRMDPETHRAVCPTCGDTYLHAYRSHWWRCPDCGWTKSNRKASTYKRRGGVCVVCGGPTSRTGKTNRPAQRCAPCYRSAGPANKRWNRANLLRVLRDFHAEFGRQPRCGDFGSSNSSPAERALQKERGWPHLDAFQRNFGTWNMALKAAGFAPKRGGRHHSETCRRCGGPADQITHGCFTCAQRLSVRWRIAAKDAA